MSKILILPGHIVTADEAGNIFSGYGIEIKDTFITSVKQFSDHEILSFDGEVIRCGNLTLIPGFVQTHVHLCQTLFRGLADDLELLDWLQYRIFPYENAHDKNSLRISVKLGLNELLSGGTTTLLDMGTLNHQEVVFEELINSGIRAIAGNCLIDQNDLFPAFKASTKDELKNTYQLAKEFHNSDKGRLKFGFTPRFILSCSEQLLKESKEMMKDFEGSIYHTHASENKKECDEIRRRYSRDNIDYFNSINVLDNHTVLAHCIHAKDDEIGILKRTNTRVAHCPSSNLKLGSGIADIPRYLKEGISVSLGADGAACNNNLSQFVEMRLASLIQKPIYGPTAMDAKTVFYLATIEGAKALHLEKETGSIEPGKKADLVLINLEDPMLPLSRNDDSFYSKIVYSCGRENITHVFVNGNWVVKNGVSLNYEEAELLNDGKAELTKLLNRG